MTGHKPLVWGLLSCILLAFTITVSAGDFLHRGTVEVVTTQTAVADGTYSVYVDVRQVERIDFRVTQSGGSGTISMQVFASWEPGEPATAKESLAYDDVGLEFYGSATFTGSPVKLIENGNKLATATFVKLVFTVAGASADASYQVVKATLRVKR
jgi:hypothetical protein